MLLGVTCLSHDQGDYIIELYMEQSSDNMIIIKERLAVYIECGMLNCQC